VRAFLQIFKLELLAALRSKTIHIFTVSCILWMLFGRHFLKGDDLQTYQLSVRYLLGVVFCVVLVALGSGAAGSVSGDRSAKRLQLTLIRPVPRCVIAMGRSLAISVTGSFVLALALVLLWWCDGRGRTCDMVYSPALENPRLEARRMFDNLIRTKEEFRFDVEKVGEHGVLKYLESLARDKYVTVDSGKSVYWTFDTVPGDVGSVKVRVRFDDSWGRTGNISGVFAFRDRKGAVGNPVKSVCRVKLDQPCPGIENPAHLVFANNSNASLTLQPRNDLKLLVPAGGFANNAFRAWLMMSFSLLCVVSVGVFLGSCLGRSVAVFTLISMLCVAAVSPATMEEYPDPLNANAVTRFSVMLTEFSSWVTSPIDRFSPVSALESDECIAWGDVGSVAVTGFLSLLLFSFASGFVMPRKGDVRS